MASGVANLIKELRRTFPEFVKAIWESVRKAEAQRLQAEAAYREGFARVRRLEMNGPELSSLKTTRVDSIQEFLACCPSLPYEAESPRIVYRGQTQHYFLDDDKSLSLRPALARSRDAVLKTPSRAIEKGFDAYVLDVLEKHIASMSGTAREAKIFLQIATEEIFPDDLYLLSKTPQGRFVRGLFPRAKLPYIFQAGLQHYGFPTLTLDVTCSPLVALFFATHKFDENRRRANVCSPTGHGGCVYVMRPNTDEIIAHPELYNLPGSTRPQFIDLFDVTWDNDSRPRRQYAALLTHALHVDLETAPQLNTYAWSIDEVIQLSDQFWQHSDTRCFLQANLGGWFFPGARIDGFFRNLRRAERHTFADYDLGELQDYPDPRGKFEFLLPQRVVLTGDDTEEVSRLLQGIWHSRKDWTGILPVPEVMRLAADVSETQPLDTVVVCGRTMHEGYQLYKQIFETGIKAGRVFGMVNASSFGEKVDPTPSFVTSFGGVPHIISGDPYDSDVLLQQRILETQLLVSRIRYDRRMKPPPSRWELFLPESFGVTPS